MSSEEDKNKTLVRRLLEETFKRNFGVIDELLAPDFVDRSLLPGQVPDREAYKRNAVDLFAPFSDIRFTIKDQIAAGDKVVSRFTTEAIHD